MVAFLLTICSLFLVYCSVPRNYIDSVSKRVNFAYSYLYPEKIVLKGVSEQQKELLPNRYYSIVCEGSAKLTLLIPALKNDAQKLYLIKNIQACGLSKITLLSDKNESKKIKINSINLSGSAAFDYSKCDTKVIIQNQNLVGLAKIHHKLNESKS